MAALAREARLLGLAAPLGLDVELWRREGLEWVRDASGIELGRQAASERASVRGGGERRVRRAAIPLELGVHGTSSAGGLPQFAWKAGCYIEVSLANLPPSTSLAHHEYTKFHRKQLSFSMVALHSFRSDGVPFVLLTFARTPASPPHAPTSSPIIPPIGSSVLLPPSCVSLRRGSCPPATFDRTASSRTELAAPRSLLFRVGLLAAELSGDVDVVDAGPESPTQIYLPVWHDNPEMATGRVGWKSSSASLRRIPRNSIEVLDTGKQLGPYEAAERVLCTSAQHFRPKIGMLTACCFPSEDGTLGCTVLRGAKGATRGTYVQTEMTTRQVELRPGSHAFVRCVDEHFLRVAVASAPFGKASGHALLAAEGPVLYAGELEVGADGLTRWNNMSGTYRPLADDAGRALLPLDKLWHVMSKIDVFEPPALDSGSGAQPGAQTQRESDSLLLVSDLEWRRSFS